MKDTRKAIEQNKRGRVSGVQEWKGAKLKGWIRGFPGGAVVENPPPMQGTRVRALVWEDPTCRGAAGPVSHIY